jgi:group I intron endonuclease
MSYIYKITNSINNKSYIGYTTNPDARWKAHQYHQGSNLVFQAIKKYGIDKFKFEIIAEDSIDNEQKYINIYNTITPNGYNINKGGDLPPNHKGKTYKEIYGIKWKEQLKKRRLTQLERGGFGPMTHTNETKKKISKNNARAMLGKKHSKKTLKLISNSKKGKHKGEGNPNAKKYELISPEGKQYKIIGCLKNFCLENNLCYSGVRKSYYYNTKLRNGWKILPHPNYQLKRLSYPYRGFEERRIRLDRLPKKTVAK